MRINLRCSACRWPTSRSVRADGDYGRCPRCDGALGIYRRQYFTKARQALVRQAEAAQRVARGQTAIRIQPIESATTRDGSAPRYRDQDATWPELVAADLQRVEDGQASQLTGLWADQEAAEGG
jgi:hypothetical protein